MLTLAIDTATRTLSVALVLDQEVLAEASEPAAQSHAERLPQLLSELLTKAKINRNQITHVAVGVGPGAYTGLRVGLMFATTFARALDIDLVGVCSHDVIATSDFSGVVVTDARRKEVYLSTYQAGKRISGPVVLKPNEIELSNQSVIGDGVLAYPEIFAQGVPVAISAGQLGILVNQAVARGETPAVFVPKVSSANSDGAGAIPDSAGLLLPALPIYLRRPDVAEPA